MPILSVTVTGTADLDDVQVGNADNSHYAGNSSLYNTSWIDIGDHPTASSRPVGGWLFTLPSELAGIDPANITSCYLEVYNATGTVSGWSDRATTCKLVPYTGTTWPSTFSNTNSPRSVFNGATAYAAVQWNGANGAKNDAWTLNTWGRGPEMATHLRQVLNGGATPGSSRVAFIAAGGNASVLTVRVQDWASGSSFNPRLVITYDVPATDADVTTTAPSADAIASDGLPWAATRSLGVNYSNGTALAAKDITDNGTRALDFWRPQGTAPTGGWPLVVWVHGGFFNSGSRSTIPSALVGAAISRGYAVTSVDYRLTESILDGFQGLANGNEQSFPFSVHDIKVALNFFRKDRLGANVYDVDVGRVVFTGFSAGTSLIQFAAFSQGDSSTYTGVTGSWTRPANVGRVTGTPYNFDFNQNGDAGIDSFTVRGMFLFGGVSALRRGVDPTFTSNADARVAISNGRRLYVSRTFVAGSVDSTLYGEMDSDLYLAPGSGTATTNEPYRGRANRPAPTYPIAYARGTADVLVPKAAGYDPLRDALATVGYAGTSPTTNEVNSTGLSYFEVTGANHDQMESHPEALGYFFQWLDSIDTGGSSNGQANADAASAAAAVSAVTVSASATRTTTAPAATALVGTATRTVSATRTTTAPAATALVGSVSVSVSAARTTTAPESTGIVGTSTASTARTVTTTAPQATATVSVPTASVSATRTTVAPQAAAAVPTPSVSASATRTTTAPLATATVATPTATASTPGATTTTAPTATATVPAPTTTASSPGATTTTAPVAAATVSTPTVAAASPGSAAVTAPSATATVATPSVVGGTAGTATVAAAAGTATIPAPTVTAAAPGSTTVVAPPATGIVPTPVIAAAAARTTTAPTATAAVPPATVTSSAARTTVGAEASAGVPAPTVTAASPGTASGTAAATATVAGPGVTVGASRTPLAIAATGAVPSPQVAGTTGPVNATVTTVAPSAAAVVGYVGSSFAAVVWRRSVRRPPRAAAARQPRRTNREST
jgi:hypothetical protein